MVQWGNELIRKLLVGHGIPVPLTIFRQINGDWTPSLRRDYRQHADHMVCDLEHLYRHLKARPDIGGWTGYVMKAVRLMAYVPTGPLFHQFWEVMLPVLADKVPTFAKYFRKECLHELRLGTDRAFLALWWSGMKSRTSAGHPASQNLAENFMNLIKAEVTMHQDHGSEIKFLEVWSKGSRRRATPPALPSPSQAAARLMHWLRCR